jgi:2-polyprenyl-3-methyl-5-hydroxy-6-metoxy-1,4-benzoquinol methylase
MDAFKNKTLISFGDFLDVYRKLKTDGWRFFIPKFKFSGIERTRTAWSHIEAIPVHWWDIPAVQERKNRLVTGMKNVEFPEYIYRKYLKGKKNLKALSPGCGTGSLEIQLARYPCFSLVEAFDLSKPRILNAVRESEKREIQNLNFHVQDIYKFDFGVSQYDLILFNGFLHHIRDVEKILIKARESLTPDGILVIHEYVGPNRFQWPRNQIKAVRELLDQIPEEYRKFWKCKRVKKKLYRPGLIRMILSDPSEAVESEAILPGLNRYFNPIEIKQLGGNLLHPLFKDIAHNFINSDEDESKQILNLIFETEDSYLKENQSDFVFGVFRKNLK